MMSLVRPFPLRLRSLQAGATAALLVLLGACSALPERPQRPVTYDFGPGATTAPAASADKPLPAPDTLPAGDVPSGDRLDDWQLEPTHPDWAGGLRENWTPGEVSAQATLADFLDGRIQGYADKRDRPDTDGTSRLSPHLRFGEISPRTLWHALGDRDDPGAEAFRSEIGWREHGLNLVDQMPDYGERNGRAPFDRFPWRTGAVADRDFRAWCRGRSGPARGRRVWRRRPPSCRSARGG